MICMLVPLQYYNSMTILQKYSPKIQFRKLYLGTFIGNNNVRTYLSYVRTKLILSKNSCLIISQIQSDTYFVL